MKFFSHSKSIETINLRGLAKFDPRGMNGTTYVEDLPFLIGDLGCPFRLTCLIRQGHSMIFINYVEQYSLMPYAKSHNHIPSGSEEEE